MNILNSNEAFAAMMAGRNIMCRAIGELIKFNDIDQFPANIFAKPGYEFCIKVETMELAGITFTKPLTLDDVMEGQEVFMIGSTGTILQGKFVPECEGLIKAIKNGFVQRDGINAQNQLRALHALLGVDGFIQHRTADFKNYSDDKVEPVKKRRSRKTEETAANDQSSTSNDVEEKTFESQSNIQITDQGPVAAAEESLIEEFVETDAVKLVEKFTAQLNAAETADDVMRIRYQLSANGHMVRGQIIELNKLGEKRIEELTTPPSESKDLSVDELKRLQEDAESLIQSKKDESTEQPVQVDEDTVYKELLADLLDRVANATTPAEVNAQIKYTKSWTEEQRNPLIDAINKRLVELNPPKVQSSLAVRIQKAEDLTELDALEIDVSACDEEIQPRLMEMVEKRRLELDPFTAAIGEP